VTLGMVIWAWAVSALLAGATAGGSALLRMGGRAERGLWGVALLGAVATGWLARGVAVTPDVVSSGGTSEALARVGLRDLLETPLPGFEAVAAVAGGVLGVLLLTGLLREVRRDRERRVARRSGVVVRIDASEGPAVVAAPWPRLVLPERFDALSTRERRIVLLHEGEHLRGGDLPLLALATVLVALAPWNPAAWWLRARLARAIETDCDRRVMRARGVDGASYAEVLLRTAGWRRQRRATVGLTLSRSGRTLARRIEAVVGGEPGRSSGRTLAAALALFMLVLAPVLPRPVDPAVVAVAEPAGTITPVFSARAIPAREVPVAPIGGGTISRAELEEVRATAAGVVSRVNPGAEPAAGDAPTRSTLVGRR